MSFDDSMYTDVFLNSANFTYGKLTEHLRKLSPRAKFDPKAVKESCQAEILRLDKIIKECDEKITAAELPYMDFDADIFAKRSPIKVVPKFVQAFKMAKSLENCTCCFHAESLQNLRGQLANRVIGTISCDDTGTFTMTLLANPDGTVYELVPSEPVKLDPRGCLDTSVMPTKLDINSFFDTIFQ